MALSAGTRLGPYEILAPLGAGGMGEVYRAKDMRLDRTVAVKVLPGDLAADEHLKARFEREAHAISALAHPNICTLHDVGQDDGIDYLVMEYLEGEPLAKRLRKGALPLKLALRYAIEIAEALDTAHRQGVVHRDLKPGNVMLTRSGAKLLDFGLASLRKGDPTDPGTSPSAISALPTQKQPLTDTGTILGTYPYMAPEQLEGKDTDGRTDLFAFGAMLHEMVTGRRAFEGESRAGCIAAILERDPAPVSTLQPLSPPGLDHVVETCLAKDPDDRWQSARDAASELRWILEAGSQAGTPAPVARRRKTRERLAWALLAVLLSVLAAGAGWAWRNASQAPPRALHASLLPPDGMRFEPNAGAMVLSPDGARVAFVASDEEGTRMLWVRSLDSLAAEPLAGTEGARCPIWSPDGRFIAFVSNGKLRKINASGGPAQALCDAAGSVGGAWGADGTILFVPTAREVIYRVPASGGTPVPATAFDESRGEFSHRFPQFLPDGHHFIFLVETAVGTPETDMGFSVFASSLDSTEKTPIVATHSSARFAASGHLLFVRGRTLVAQPFDPDTLDLSGDEVPIARGLSPSFWRETIFSVSDTGRLLFQAGPASEDARLVWFDRNGRELGTVGHPADYRVPILSPDQKRIAVAIKDPQTQQEDIWVLDIERGTSTRLTFDPAYDYAPLWSVDGRVIYFTSERSGQGDVYSKSSSGTEPAELVYGSDRWDVLTDRSPDGNAGWLVSINSTAGTGPDIYRVDLDSHEVEVALQTPFGEGAPALSPDGRWLLYASNESGRTEVYVRSLDEDGGKWRISIDGGRSAQWTRGGTEIVFQAGDGQLMAIEVTPGPTFSAGIPEALFNTGDTGRPGWWGQYDVTPDGNRFLVNQLLEHPNDEPLTLVLNWENELER